MDYHVHAGMSEQDYADFISAVTSEICESLAEYYPDIDPHECFDPLLEVYGLEFNPIRLHDTTDKQMRELTEAFSEFWEVPVPEEAVRDAVARARARWPV